MAKICVAHLVRQANALDSLQAFIRSYQDNEAGGDHDLTIIFKGFQNEEATRPHRELLNGLNYDAFFVPDRGFDIGAYLAAARAIEAEFFCFFNSFSVILEKGWLEKLALGVMDSSVGLVGASGSAESHFTNYLKSLEDLPSAKKSPSAALRRLAGNQLRLRQLRALERDFAPFPNYHLRTNAFIISRSLLLSLQAGPFQVKNDAEKFESGVQGLTRQILERGLRALVVGRDGQVYEPEKWSSSRTFRSGDQENLLIADNRTRQYEAADEAQRRLLHQATWGGQTL